MKKNVGGAGVSVEFVVAVFLKACVARRNSFKWNADANQNDLVMGACR